MAKAKLPERKRLALTWLDRVVSAQERAGLPPEVKVWAASALVADGSLYVVVMEALPPPGVGNVRMPVAIHVTHTVRAGIVQGDATLAPTGKGRSPTIAELDAVAYHFARGRVVALMFDGSGVPTGPAYYELVEIAGAVMPQGPPGLVPPSA